MARTVSEIYADFLTENFLKDQLKQGVIPSPEEIDLFIQNKSEETVAFTEPLFKEDIYLINEKENSSTKKMNETFDLLYSDLSVLYRSLVDQGQQVSKIFDSNFSKLKGFEKDLKELSEDVESLLFESQNSDRYEDLFYEKFKNAHWIDEVNSTTDHDLSTTSITLKPDNVGILDFDIKAGDLEVSPVNTTSVLSSAAISGMDPINMFSDQNQIWQHQVVTSEDVPTMSIDFIIRIPDSSKDISRIVLEPADASNRTQMSLEIKVSEDGLNWNKVDGEWRKRIIGDTTFSFKGTKTSYVKLRFIKSGVDAAFSGEYQYNFGLKNLKFIGTEYKIEKRIKTGLFYSKPILPKKTDYISRLGIMSCHTKPEGSSIRYLLGLLTQSQLADYTVGTIGPEDLVYYPIDIDESKQLETFDTQSLLETEQYLNNLSLNDTIDYEFKLSTNTAIDLDVSPLLKAETRVLRRQGDNTAAQVTGKESFISSDPIGWVVDGEFYSTTVRITQHGGQTLSLGQTSLFIDGAETSGEAHLSEGFHRVKVHKNNWHSIDLVGVTAVSNNPDILYPYNHKYMIEGLDTDLYGQDLDADQGGWTYREIIDPDGVYHKKMNHWALEMRELETFEFDSSKVSLDTFSYKVDNNGVERLVVHVPNKNDLLLNERFSIITKVQDSDPIKAVILKASLDTEDEKVTPIVTEYLMRIK